MHSIPTKDLGDAAQFGDNGETGNEVQILDLTRHVPLEALVEEFDLVERLPSDQYG